MAVLVLFNVVAVAVVLSELETTLPTLLSASAQITNGFRAGAAKVGITPPPGLATGGHFNGTLRNECLTLEWFRNRMDAKVSIERRRRHYNEERSHMSLGDQTPAEFKAQLTTTNGWLRSEPEDAVLQQSLGRRTQARHYDSGR